MKYTRVAFDLDGTITDSAAGICRSAAFAFKEMGKPVPDESVLLTFVGPSIVYSFTHTCGLTEEEARRGLELFRQRHNEIGWKECTVYPGMFQLLRDLHASGAYVAVASAKPEYLCRQTLEYYGLSGFFDKIIGTDGKKTDNSKASLILEALDGNTENACMVGDRVFDMDGAREAKVVPVAAGFGYGSAEELQGKDIVYCPDVDALRKELLGDTVPARGTFISFEGSDGCGKSTQHRLLGEFLQNAGLRVVSTREPGGCAISERIRNVLLDVKSLGMTDECEALLFAAARNQHVHDTIEPALERGDMVLCDRFVDSSIAYQGAGRGLGDWVKQINMKAVNGCLPDMTLVFDISPEEAISRRLNATEADRIELSKDDFRKRVHEAFMGMCESGDSRFVRIDAHGSIEEIQSLVRNAVLKKLAE